MLFEKRVTDILQKMFTRAKSYQKHEQNGIQNARNGQTQWIVAGHFRTIMHLSEQILPKSMSALIVINVA
jgi:hypothetical protein